MKTARAALLLGATLIGAALFAPQPHGAQDANAKWLRFVNDAAPVYADFALAARIQAQLDARAQRIRASAADFARDPASAGTALLPFSLTVSGERFTTPAYDGVLLKIREDTGGAHANLAFVSYTVDARGREQTLAQYLQAAALDEAALVANINRELARAREATGEPIAALETLDAISAWNIVPREDTRDAHSTNNALRITFNPYILAPWSTGPLTVTVPVK